MTADTDWKPGQRVRFTTGPLGTIRPGYKGFAEVSVETGDLGEVLSVPEQLPDGWLAVKPDGAPDLFVPVHPSMIEVA